MCSYPRVSIKPGWSGEWSFGSWSCWRRSICQVPFQVCAIGPRFHCCFDLFVARHLHLQVCDLARLMAMRNLSPFRQTTQALGLLEHLAQDQAASVALRLRDPYLGWLWRCPCSPVGFPVEPSGAGQSGHALWERFTSLGLQQCQSWHPDWRTQMAVDDCCVSFPMGLGFVSAVCNRFTV